jgi:hypothetical protein
MVTVRVRPDPPQAMFDVLMRDGYEEPVGEMEAALSMPDPLNEYVTGPRTWFI